MMGCKGVAIIGYFHQPVCTKLQTFSGYTSHGFFPQPKFNFNNSFKLRKVSHVEGGNSRLNPSFLSFSGDGRSSSDYGFSEVGFVVYESEDLFLKRALAAFHLDCNKWGVTLEPSSDANFAASVSILKYGDRIMYLNLTHEGQLSHRNTSKYFEIMIMPYRLDESTDLIDYDMLEKTTTEFRPKIIVACASAYSPDIDCPRVRKIADEVGAFFMMDMTHISGPVSDSIFADPFEFCDIVTFTTHKYFPRGPRGGMIFFKKGSVHGVDLESAIYNCLAPYLKGRTILRGNYTIGGLKDSRSSNIKNYQKQVVPNRIALANRLTEHGYTLVSGGSENHMVLVDLSSFGVDGALVEKILDMDFITVNKNFVPGDKNAQVSDVIRIRTQALTTRGLSEKEFELIADLIHESVVISLEAKSLVSGTTVQDFLNFVSSPEFSLADKVTDLRRKVQALSTQYPIPGVHDS